MNKPLNPWANVALSLVPLANLIPLAKLGKIRKMTLVIICIGVGAFGISFGLLEFGLTVKDGALLPVFSIIPLIYVVQSILVYGWIKKHNQALQIKS